MNKNIFKSILACVAGVVSGVVLTLLTDLILEKTGVFPPQTDGLFIWWMLLIALIYRGIYLAFAGYVTAKLSPDNPKKHVMIIGIIAVVVTILGSVANWQSSNEWYPIALIIITYPCTMIGGKFLKQ